MNNKSIEGLIVLGFFGLELIFGNSKKLLKSDKQYKQNSNEEIHTDNENSNQIIVHEFGHASPDVYGEATSMLNDYDTIMISNLRPEKKVEILYKGTYNIF